MSIDSETIVAIATPPGNGGVGIVRISGSDVTSISQSLLKKSLRPRFATYADFYAADDNIIDTGIALYFAAPNSFTGEDVLELHGHGGAVVLDVLVQRIIELGARLARPGEFSERAFLNGKMDLTQAEAVADLINAKTCQAAQNAAHSLHGDFAKYINTLIDKVIHLRTYVEAAIDFAEENIDFLAMGQVGEHLASIINLLDTTFSVAKQGVLLRDGATLVIAGAPNVGKSSLLNNLSGEATAIVTALPGTTRDVLQVHINLDGIPLHILDTAGLRVSDDPIEQEGIRRAQLAIERADHVLLLADVNEQPRQNLQNLFQELLGQVAIDPEKITLVYNKIDKLDDKQRTELLSASNTANCIYISAKTGEGITQLRQHIRKVIGFNSATESKCSARRRHLVALDNAKQHLVLAQSMLQQGTFELVAEELRLAQQYFGAITGAFSTEDLLDRIFREFCLGK